MGDLGRVECLPVYMWWRRALTWGACDPVLGLEAARRIHSNSQSTADGAGQWRHLADSVFALPSALWRMELEAACDNNDKETRDCSTNPCPIDCAAWLQCGMPGSPLCSLRRCDVGLEGLGRVGSLGQLLCIMWAWHEGRGLAGC